MSEVKICATCGVPLPADAPEGAICHACSLEGQGTAALPEDFQPVTPPTRPTPSRTPSFSLPPGPIAATTIGDYEVTGKLGQGGMGAVYRATQISLGREVALKVLPAQFEADEDYVGRFQREAKVAASLSHPNLVRVYASGEADGSHYIAMELVEGENLRQRLKRGGLDMAEALRICTDVARGLQCGWQKAQLIHRDIKPSNIYLSHSGEVKLGDLGLAKSLSENSTGLTQTGAAMGTPHYMSPEQARGEKNLDFRADIYSLGCTLYELLTGAPPYSGTDGLTIIHQHINAPIPAILKVLPSCPLPVARLVARMLKKNRHERPGSYEDLITELENVRAQVEGGATFAGPSAVVEAWKKVGDLESAPAASYGLLWAGMALLLLMGSGIAWWAIRPKTLQNLHISPAIAPKTTPLSSAGLPQSASGPLSNSASAAALDRKNSLPSSAERWENLLSDSASVRSRGAEHIADGLRFADWGFFTLSDQRIGQRDGAIRMRAVYGGGRLQLMARDNKKSYLLMLTGNDRLQCELSDSAMSNAPSVLAQFVLPVPLVPGAEYEIELRTVGHTLTALYNREVVGTITDDGQGAGRFGVKALGARWFDGQPGPALIKAIEFLDLDTPAAEPWQDMIRNSMMLSLPTGVERTPEGLRITEACSIHVGLREEVVFHFQRKPSKAIKRDAAVRMRTTFGGQRPSLRARANNAGSMYQLTVSRDGKSLGLSRYDGQEGTKLRDYTLRTALQPGQDYDLELRVVGNTCTIRCNDEMFSGLMDGVIGEGLFGLGLGVFESGLPSALVKSLEFLDLDAPAAPSAASTPASATKDAPFVNSLGMKFVPVPITGGPTGGKRVLFSIWETRVQDYEAFVKETGRQSIKPPNFEQDGTHPVVRVTFDDATAFCVWLTQRERKSHTIGDHESYRLPKDHEWSCAAGIGAKEDPAELPEKKNGKLRDIFIWGSQWPPPPKAGNFWSEELRPLLAAGKLRSPGQAELSGYQDGYAATAPAGSFAPSQLGLFDLTGNALEWCEDLFDDSSPRRVIRGASFVHADRGDLGLSSRSCGLPTVVWNELGFRVVLAPAP